MHPLLGEVIEAHGGLRRWQETYAVTTEMSIGGQLWETVGLPDRFKNVRVVCLTDRQHLEIDLLDGRETLVYDSGEVKVRSSGGEYAIGVVDVRSRFFSTERQPAWTLEEAAYFNGYALWQYLNAPFLFAEDGFEVTEVEPWQEDGETWRVLQVTFPERYVAHTRVQYAYIAENRLLQRLRYTVDILGGAQGVNYASDYRVVSGIALPFRRKVFPHDAAFRKVEQPLLVSIRMDELSLIHEGSVSRL